jgi:hypothetical protein
MHFRKLLVIAAMGCLLSLSPLADAGPPAICHPFETGSAPVLPWGEGRGWNSPDRNYDTTRLRNDLLGVLSPNAPIIARMENMRRATLYAGNDPELAADLVRVVIARVDWEAKPEERDPLAWFDAGYLLETYRQWNVVGEWGMSAVEAGWLPAALGQLDIYDGYAMIQAAIVAAGGSADMEYAASLVTSDDALFRAHHARAAAGAPTGSLLALNLYR